MECINWQGENIINLISLSGLVFPSCPTRLLPKSLLPGDWLKWQCRGCLQLYERYTHSTLNNTHQTVYRRLRMYMYVQTGKYYNIIYI